MDPFAALAVPTRRRIIELLAKEHALAASDIYSHFSVSAPTISQHLKVLREAKLVIVERIAQKRMYSVNKQKLAELERWTQEVSKAWDEKYRALDAVLEKQSKQRSNHGKQNRS